MAAIKGRHTKPELTIRKALHAAGLRYRLHAKDLPGKPDLVFPRYRAAVFVNGCFWHQHDCHLFNWPATRDVYWRTKISRNAENDARATAALKKLDWRVGMVWECALKGRTRLDEVDAMQQLAAWIRSDGESIIIRGGCQR